MTLPHEFKKFDLVAGGEVPKRRRLVLTSEGGPGVGKTHLFYSSAPRPALVIQGDQNDEHLRESYSNDIVFKDIILPPFIKHDEEQRAKDEVLYRTVRDLYRTAVITGYFRSIMIDEGAWLYTLVRRSFLWDLGFGGSQQQSYAPVNAAMDRFYTLAKQHRVNLYIPHRQTDERDSYITDEGKKGSRMTGRKTAAGWKESLYTSQCHLLLEKDPTFTLTDCAECGRPRNGKNKCSCERFVKPNAADKFSATIVKCSARASIEGKKIPGSELSWQTLGQLVFPHSDESDWE